MGKSKDLGEDLRRWIVELRNLERILRAISKKLHNTRSSDQTSYSDVSLLYPGLEEESCHPRGEEVRMFRNNSNNKTQVYMNHELETAGNFSQCPHWNKLEELLNCQTRMKPLLQNCHLQAQLKFLAAHMNKPKPEKGLIVRRLLSELLVGMYI